MKSFLLANFASPTILSLSAVFVCALATATCVEIALWRAQTLLSFVIPFVIYTLGSLRFLPWKNPTWKSFSLGLMVGMFAPLILYSFGFSFSF